MANKLIIIIQSYSLRIRKWRLCWSSRSIKIGWPFIIVDHWLLSTTRLSCIDWDFDFQEGRVRIISFINNTGSDNRDGVEIFSFVFAPIKLTVVVQSLHLIQVLLTECTCHMYWIYLLYKLNLSPCSTIFVLFFPYFLQLYNIPAQVDHLRHYYSDRTYNRTDQVLFLEIE